MVDIVPFETRETRIDGLVVATMKSVTDERGTIREFFRASAFAEAGLGARRDWQQINITETRRGAVRGMHGEDMTKLVSVITGAAHGAYVDTRTSSPTRGIVEQVRLVPGVQVLVPAGVCNGFQVLEDRTQYLYCFDEEWRPDMAGSSVSPVDPALGIDWPIPIDVDDLVQLSAKDRSAPRLADVLDS